MNPVGTQVLLVGAATPVGRELLLRLAVLGFEVIAFMPDGDDGQTGEFACALMHDRQDAAAAADAGAVVVQVEAEVPGAVVVSQHGRSRRFLHAPTMRHVAERVRTGDWRAWLGDPWAGHALPVVHERDVAAIVAESLLHDRPATAIGGPEPLSWHDVVRAVLAADGRGRLWRRVVGRWATPEVPEATLAAMARFPRTGRRTLADALTRRESAARPPVATVAAGARHTPHS